MTVGDENNSYMGIVKLDDKHLLIPDHIQTLYNAYLDVCHSRR